MPIITTILAALRFRAGKVAVQKVPRLVFRAQVDTETTHRATADAETRHRARVNSQTTHRVRVDAL